MVGRTTAAEELPIQDLVYQFILTIVSEPTYLPSWIIGLSACFVFGSFDQYRKTAMPSLPISLNFLCEIVVSFAAIYNRNAVVDHCQGLEDSQNVC